MPERTIFYGLQLHSADLEKTMAEVTEHLSMNGYTFDTNGEDTLFVYSEEVDYVETILKDRDISFHRI